MSDIKQLRSQLMMETAAHFNADNRAVFIDTCVYEDSKGNRCAIGRMMTDEGLRRAVSKRGQTAAVMSVLEPDLFQEKWRPLINADNLDFLISIQLLHDQEWNWGSFGLSEQGRRRTAELRKTFMS